MNSIIESFAPSAATMGGGFVVGILIGYALKKVIKMVAVILGLFLAGLAYLQYHQIANINWNKVQTVSDGAITTLSNAIAQIPGISLSSGDSSHAAATASSLAMTSFGIPLTCKNISRIYNWIYERMIITAGYPNLVDVGICS
jgi:uncharacterized membrane protein (Fun14 family)